MLKLAKRFRIKLFIARHFIMISFDMNVTERSRQFAVSRRQWKRNIGSSTMPFVYVPQGNILRRERQQE